MTTTITNTIVASYTIGLERVAGTVTVWNTLFNGNTTNISGTVTTNTLLSGDPLFVDPANGNYHLGAGSPAIDAGDAVSCPTTDVRGAARGDLACDLGAYELIYADVSLYDRAFRTLSSTQPPPSVRRLWASCAIRVRPIRA